MVTKLSINIMITLNKKSKKIIIYFLTNPILKNKVKKKLLKTINGPKPKTISDQ